MIVHVHNIKMWSKRRKGCEPKCQAHWQCDRAVDLFATSRLRAGVEGEKAMVFLVVLVFCDGHARCTLWTAVPYEYKYQEKGSKCTQKKTGKKKRNDLIIGSIEMILLNRQGSLYT